MGSLHQAFLAACGSSLLYPPLLQDSARSTWIKSTANILLSCFKTVSLSSQQKRWGMKEFSTLRRLTLLIFSVTVAAMRSKLASLCGGQTKAKRTARCRSLVKVESSLCLALRRRLLWRRRLAIRSRSQGWIASRCSALLLATMAGPTSWKVFRGSPSAGRLRAPSLSRLASALMRVTSEQFGQTILCEEPALLSGTLIPRGQVSGLIPVLTQGRTTSIEDETIIETSSSGTDYFAKGHLSPDAAFVYNVLQDATYYFINVAPQFQSFNNGNWKALEMAVRDLGTKFGRDLVVTTGTHEVLEYPDKSNSPTDIYLARIESYVPALKYYWKVVQDPETKTGAAFIGLNDPHTNVAPMELCKNRCSEMSSWVDWGIENLDAGYMYCCSIEDASKAIKAIPDMTAPGGLIGRSSSPSTGGGDFSATGSCQAGPCQCSCAKNDQGVYTCTCTCNN